MLQGLNRLLCRSKPEGFSEPAKDQPNGTNGSVSAKTNCPFADFFNPLSERFLLPILCPRFSQPGTYLRPSLEQAQAHSIVERPHYDAQFLKHRRQLYL